VLIPLLTPSTVSRAASAPAVMQPRPKRPLRTRAWWVMRAMPVFSMPDLLMTCATASDLAARSNLNRYLAALLRAGVLESAPALPGQPPVWRLARDLGPLAPSISRSGELTDPNPLASPPRPAVSEAATASSGAAATRNRARVLAACTKCMPATIDDLCREARLCATVVRRHLRALELRGELYRISGPIATDPDLWMVATTDAQRRAAAERAAASRNTRK
jgi:hypothetical protein